LTSSKFYRIFVQYGDFGETDKTRKIKEVKEDIGFG
jgi:hypothetical protein